MPIKSLLQSRKCIQSVEICQKLTSRPINNKKKQRQATFLHFICLSHSITPPRIQSTVFLLLLFYHASCFFRFFSHFTSYNSYHEFLSLFFFSSRSTKRWSSHKWRTTTTVSNWWLSEFKLYLREIASRISTSMVYQWSTGEYFFSVVLTNVWVFVWKWNKSQMVSMKSSNEGHGKKEKIIKNKLTIFSNNLSVCVFVCVDFTL